MSSVQIQWNSESFFNTFQTSRKTRIYKNGEYLLAHPMIKRLCHICSVVCKNTSKNSSNWNEQCIKTSNKHPINNTQINTKKIKFYWKLDKNIEIQLYVQNWSHSGTTKIQQNSQKSGSFRFCTIMMSWFHAKISKA